MRSHKLNSSNFLTQVISALCVLTFSNTAVAKDWRLHQSSMSVFDQDIKKLNEEINGLIEDKRKTDEPSELRVITQAMADKHKAIQKLDKDRQKEYLHMRFQHPEKGEQQKREYSREKIKSLEEMESEFGLDARLNRIQAKIRKTFGTEKEATKLEAAGKPGPERLPASEGVERNRPSDADEQIRFSK